MGGAERRRCPTITNCQRIIKTQQKFEDGRPECRETREAVAAYAGVFEDRPLANLKLAVKAVVSGHARTAVAEAGA